MTGDFTPWGRRKKSLGWIEDEHGCHIWTGYRDADGYGHVRDGLSMRRVHAVRYEREVGPIPEGMELDHFRCDNGAGGCCNPHHCRPVTHRENILRSDSAGALNRAKDRCPRGHRLTDDNVVPSQLRRFSRRSCLICHRVAAKLCNRRRRARA